MNGILLVPESGVPERFKVDGGDLDTEVLFTHTDADGITWIGFAHRGLCMYDPAMKAFQRRSAPVKDEPVLSSLEIPGKGLLTGTPTGLYLSNPKGSALLLPGATASLARASNGDVWVGTEKEGVVVLDPSLRIKRRFDSRNSPLRQNRIHHLACDGGGDRMVVSTIDGAYVHSMSDGAWKSLSVGQPGDASSALCGSYVLHAKVLGNGDLVVSTNNGFSVLGRRGDVKRKVHSDNDSCRFIRKTIITGSTEDATGRLWISTLSRGVYVADADSFLNIGETHGLSSNLVYGIETDVRGRLWVATSSGMDVIDPGTRKILHLSEYNGLPTADFSFGCLVRGDGDVLRINSSIGMVTVKTAQVEPQGIRVTPFMQAVKVNYEDVDLKSDYALGPLDKTLSFEFSAPYYRDPDNLAFQYRIRRIQDKWVTLESGSRNLTLTNLPDGAFTLELRCSDGTYDMEQAETIETRIKIPLPFWRNPFYITASVLSLMALVVYVVRRSAKKTMEEKLRESEMSELLYKERERISRDLHDNLGAYAACIRNNVVELERRSEGGSELSSLRENTDVLMNALRETIWVLQNETVSITSLSDRFKNIVNRIGAGYPDVTIEVHDLIQREARLSPTEGINLMRIMQEALTNSIKHSGCSRVRIDIESSDALRVSVTDDGTGFDTRTVREGSYGIRNMRERAREAGFDLRLESGASGTAVHIGKISGLEGL
jgi:signal transduction histidine kinase